MPVLTAENARNSRKRAGTTSRYKGVLFRQGEGPMGRLSSGVDYKCIALGHYETEEAAARSGPTRLLATSSRNWRGHELPGTEALSPDEIRERRQPIRRGQSSVVKSRSGYRGVTWHAKCRLWQARIHADGRTRSLGYHKTPEDAARAYDQGGPLSLRRGRQDQFRLKRCRQRSAHADASVRFEPLPSPSVTRLSPHTSLQWAEPREGVASGRARLGPAPAPAAPLVPRLPPKP